MHPATLKSIRKQQATVRKVLRPTTAWVKPNQAVARLELHPGQSQARDEARRFNVLDCGRRFGKTIFGIDLLIDPLLGGYPVGWFTPSYKYMLEVWRTAGRVLKPRIVRSNAQERRMVLDTGGVLECWTLDGPDGADAGRSRHYARAIIDEAAKVPNLERAWTEGIRATLTDLKGDAWFLSTPKGRNFFWRIYERGKDPEQPQWMSWQMPTSVNPYIDDAEIEAAKGELPDSVFRQEYLAEFLEDGGGVFRRVRANATAKRQERPQDGHEYVMGVDWGRHHDFTVLTVFDVTTNAVAQIDRYTGIDYGMQLDRLRALAKRFGVSHIQAEYNSMGGPLVEQLMSDGLPIEAFQTTNDSKTGIIRELERAFENDEIKIIADDVLISELEAYEQDRLPSGRWKFSAPEGMHDDTVISLALALYAANQPVLDLTRVF